MILAIVLSALVLIGWSYLSRSAGCRPPTRRSTKIENGKQVPTPQPQASPGAHAPAAVRDRAVVLARDAARRDRARRASPARSTSRARGSTISCSPSTARAIGANSPPVRLLSPAGARGAYFAGFGWTGQGVAAARRRHGLDGERQPR